MTTPSPLRLLAFAIPFALAPIVFAATMPSWIEDDYRACLAISADDELEDRVDVYEDFYDASLDDLRTYQHDVRTGWNVQDETQRKTFLKQAERDYATRTKNRQATLKDRTSFLKEAKADTDTYCKQRRDDAKKFIADKCVSSADCASGKTCTTQLGACDDYCPIGSMYCPHACAGTCVKP